MRSGCALVCPVLSLCPVDRRRVLAALHDDVWLGLSTVTVVCRWQCRVLLSLLLVCAYVLWCVVACACLV